VGQPLEEVAARNPAGVGHLGGVCSTQAASLTASSRVLRQPSCSAACILIDHRM